MMAWLFGLSGKIKARLAAAAVLIVAIFAAYLKGRSEGGYAERLKRERERLKSIQQKRKSDDEIDRLGPADIDRELAKWMRDDG